MSAAVLWNRMEELGLSTPQAAAVAVLGLVDMVAAAAAVVVVVAAAVVECYCLLIILNIIVGAPPLPPLRFVP